MDNLNNDCGTNCQKAEKKKVMAKNAITAIEKVEEKEKEAQVKDASKEDESTAALAKKALEVVASNNNAKPA